MRRAHLLAGAVALSAVLAPAGATGAGASPAPTAARSTTGAETEYVVLYKSGHSTAAARAAITRAGGAVRSENTKLGYAVATSRDTGFAGRVDASAELDGAARNRVIGVAPNSRPSRDDVERLPAERRASRGMTARSTKSSVGAAAGTVQAEPLADRQWDMRQIGATATGSYARDKGKRGVMVGIIDTGVDGTHPDIKANFDAALSHNFTTDIPLIDGPCEHASCVDPANEDDNGHGTHVASTVGSPINGLGMAGVAPGVTLVNIRAGQDSGYFFLQPTLEALTYAGDIGVDVVNMSFYTDPWLFNCLHNSADSPAERSEQRVIRTATQRAVSYATNHGVLPVSAEGNEATDLGHPTTDDTSPDFPPNSAKHRNITNACITVPTETRGVVAVSATGPTTRKAYYSNYGTEQTDVAAPGGDYYDSPDNTGDPRNLVLAAYPKRLARINGDLNPDGSPNNPFVVRDCKGTTCAYYQYLQGTSMASPHAAGVAALVVGHAGRRDARHGGLTLNPSRTASLLYASAVPHACPVPRLFQYIRITSAGTVTSSAYCAGPVRDNGFYGPGIVNAYGAVTSRG